MEATLLGIRAIALSQDLPSDAPPDWSAAEHWGAEVIRKAISVEWPRNELVNVNFPALPAAEVKGIEVVQHGNMKIADDLVERIDPRGRSSFWIGVSRNEEEIPTTTDFQAPANGRTPGTPTHIQPTPH